MNEAFLRKYGNPDANGDGIIDTAWFNENIRVFVLPYPMPISWGDHAETKRFQAHRLAGDRIIAALVKMREFAQIEANEENEKKDALVWMRENKYDVWGGCFEWRAMRSGAARSTHSWGTSVDINPDRGGMNNTEDKKYYPAWIVRAFESQGFYWGGRFPVTDPMHMELQD
jgi:hypothetical protein